MIIRRSRKRKLPGINFFAEQWNLKHRIYLQPHGIYMHCLSKTLGMGPSRISRFGKFSKFNELYESIVKHTQHARGSVVLILFHKLTAEKFFFFHRKHYTFTYTIAQAHL